MSLPREHQNALAWGTLEHPSASICLFSLSYSQHSCAHAICSGESLEKAEPNFGLLEGSKTRYKLHHSVFYPSKSCLPSF